MITDANDKNKEGLTSQQILQNAITHEKNSMELYLEASEKTEVFSCKELFKFLAKEEEKHIYLLQDEYDKVFQKDN